MSILLNATDIDFTNSETITITFFIATPNVTISCDITDATLLTANNIEPKSILPNAVSNTEATVFARVVNIDKTDSNVEYRSLNDIFATESETAVTKRLIKLITEDNNGDNKLKIGIALAIAFTILPKTVAKVVVKPSFNCDSNVLITFTNELIP